MNREVVTPVTPVTVSVVIPAYNAADFIERTLDSVLAQTYRSYEVIVVDDGSSDGTHQVVERWLARTGVKGRCIRQPNGKIAAARNTGMKASRGEFIALLDHDDLWDPHKLEVVMAEFQSHPDVDLICHNERITRNGKTVGVTRNGPWVEDMYESLLFKGNTLSPSATVVRKAKALSIGGFRENPEFNTVEDYDFWMRLSQRARFHFLDRVLGEYTLLERAASRSIEYHTTNAESILKEHLRSRFGDNPGLLARLRTRRRLAVVYRSAARQLMDYRESPELQRTYVWLMIRTFPFDPKNVAQALAWIARAAVQTVNQNAKQ
jgi:glycosyltransferase involved in cell wall biosynthesis